MILKNLRPNMYINAKLLLFISFIAMFIVYFLILPLNKVVQIVLDEYIIILLTIVASIFYVFFKTRLKGKQLYKFIKQDEYLPIKSVLGFFFLFQIIDYYFEDGFIGMISNWFMYWIFALFLYLLLNNINYFKNYKAYKSYEDL